MASENYKPTVSESFSTRVAEDVVDLFIRSYDAYVPNPTSARHAVEQIIEKHSVKSCENLEQRNLEPFITLTGADEKTDIQALAALDAEIGILVTTDPDGRNRYPRLSWIREAICCLPRVALHICGRGARRLLLDCCIPLDNVSRIQVNGYLTVETVQMLCSLYGDRTIITQHHAGNAHLLSVPSENHAVLVDASGGRGISPNGWPALATKKAIGFAGGLGPDNLATELAEIQQVAKPGWWCDMEGKLRVDDWFSVERAKECVALFEQHLRTA